MSTLTPKTAGLVNLSYCVASVQADIQDYTDRHVERFTQWAINAYTELNIFHSNNVEVEYLEMDANGIVDLSPLTDYIDYIKVAMMVNGKYWTLGVNEKIGLRRDELDASELALIFKTGAPSIEVGSGYVFADHYVNGTYRTGMFGLGGGFNRSCFRVDKERNQLQFDSDIPRNQIVLEYYSTGVNATGGTLIPRPYVEYIKAYIRWQMEENDPRSNRFDRRDKRQLFYDEENKVENFHARFNPVKYMTTYYEGMKQTVKM